MVEKVLLLYLGFISTQCTNVCQIYETFKRLCYVAIAIWYEEI